MFKSFLSLALVASAAAFAPSMRPSFVGGRSATSLFNSIEDKVKEIICEQLGVEPEKIVPEASFVDDLGADSLDTVELVMALEEEFDMEMEDEEAEKIITVQAAIDFVNSMQ
mmetsp:Transcript_7699/g.10999  ORF Transcript_7699/g.10999 Transcript_7699/m.10999 type:complete len:112 (+) Transcript_7699:142-477(+)